MKFSFKFCYTMLTTFSNRYWYDGLVPLYNNHGITFDAVHLSYIIGYSCYKSV